MAKSIESIKRMIRPWVMDAPAGDEEAPKDPGAYQPNLQGYSELDYEGHRAHTVFVGVHVPGQHKRRSHHRRHKHHHKHGEKETEEERPITPPAQRVQFILGEYESGAHEPHPLFSEMEELVLGNGKELEWTETARWIKFEEDVDEGGLRWSKPHVATLSLHSLFEVRSLILNGTVMLDMEATSLEQIADLVLDNLISADHLLEVNRDKVKDALLRRHRHLHERQKETSSTSNVSKLPIIRSLAEIGRSHSSSKSSNMASEGLEQSPSSQSIARNQSAGVLGGNGIGTNGDHHHTNGDHITKQNTQFMRKIPPGAEASNILVGEVDFLDKTLSVFVRLVEAVHLGDLTEVPVPTRFLFVLLGPANGSSSYHEVGRAMATLMSDEVFHDVAYKAKNRGHLLAAVDEFLDAVTVLPPGEWDPNIRIEPPAAIPSQDIRKHPKDKKDKDEGEGEGEEDEEKIRKEAGLTRTGHLFGGLINDVKRKAPWYLSDFKDAVAIQCVASWIFLYFACLTPIITFGGLLGDATKQNMAAMESLVSGFVCGMGYGFLSGNPLTVLGSTGPVLVFESILFDFCKSQGIDYLGFRSIIGIYVGIILLILVMVDASAFVCYITRFTEENFATLIAFIFIYQAIAKIGGIVARNPMHQPATLYEDYVCTCLPNDSLVSSFSDDEWSLVANESCRNAYNSSVWKDVGCQKPDFHPNVALMSILLFLGTFLISVFLKDFKNSAFFPNKVRSIISDFAVIIAILSMTLLDVLMKVDTPKLQVPSEFKPTLSTRGWLIHPLGPDGENPIWTIFAGPIPALLATILIFMDQQITAVIVNRKENKLNKGGGYHLDLFVLSILIIICSVMGLPWFVAATVLSINHVNSLKMESECAAPGEKPKFLGVREQRVTHILIFATIGLSVVLTPALRLIPMPVLFGVFLYMGVASLKGLQFFDRLLIMLMPVKYQPDFIYLRQVPLKRVHMFTLIQLACLIVLWVIKSFKQTSIFFPLMLVIMIGVRKLLDFVFTQRELKILDDIMPETIRRSKEDEQWERESEDEDLDGGITMKSTGKLEIPLANGNIMKIPLAAINISEEVNKSGIWKQVNSDHKDKTDKDKDKDREKDGGDGNDKTTSSSNKNKKRGSKRDAVNEEERKRLSMLEEEEEEGITIKIDRHFSASLDRIPEYTDHVVKTNNSFLNHSNKANNNNSETRV